jgi:RNA polymerase sigma factor (sigma-70 family)
MQQQKHVSSQYQALSDSALVQHAQAGRAWAFEFLFQRYSAAVFGLICHYLGKSEYDRACDIAQHVWLQFYLCLPTFRQGSPVKPWLLQVTRNRCIDDFRQHSRQAIPFSMLETGEDEEEFSPLQSITDNSLQPEELAERCNIQECILQAIEGLPSQIREVVFLRYARQLSFQEIAQALHVPESTVKSRFQRAKPLLRASLQDSLN